MGYRKTHRFSVLLTIIFYSIYIALHRHWRVHCSSHSYLPCWPAWKVRMFRSMCFGNTTKSSQWTRSASGTEFSGDRSNIKGMGCQGTSSSSHHPSGRGCTGLNGWCSAAGHGRGPQASEFWCFGNRPRGCHGECRGRCQWEIIKIGEVKIAKSKAFRLSHGLRIQPLHSRMPTSQRAIGRRHGAVLPVYDMVPLQMSRDATGRDRWSMVLSIM